MVPNSTATTQWGDIGKILKISYRHQIFLKIVGVVININGGSWACTMAWFLYTPGFRQAGGTWYGQVPIWDI